MKRATKLATGLMLSSAFGVLGCNSSAKTYRAEGLAELQRMSSAVQDMNVVVSVGATRDQYSQRLTDALLKFGWQSQGCKKLNTRFREGDEQSSAESACQYLLTAMDAYTCAKDYIGPKADPIDPELPDYNLTEKEYADIKSRFPDLEALPITETNREGYKFYLRSDMVQALWRLADRESELSKEAIENLTRP